MSTSRSIRINKVGFTVCVHRFALRMAEIERIGRELDGVLTRGWMRALSVNTSKASASEQVSSPTPLGHIPLYTTPSSNVLKTETRLIDEMFASEMGECVFLIR